MKFILLLILMLNMSLGLVCPGTTFTGVVKSKFPFAGKFQYSKEKVSFRDEVFDLEEFKIDNIAKGILEFKEKEKDKDSGKIDRNYFSSNLECYSNPLDEYDIDNNFKSCTLEYISLERGYSFVKQLRFTYNIPDNDNDNDCEDQIQSSLDKGLTCKIDYLETDYQIFYLPYTDNNNKYIKFNTKTKMFELDNGGLVNDISIKIIKNNASLLQNKKEIVKFDKTNSCYALLRKIKDLMSKPLEDQCPEGNKYSYFKFKFNEDTDSSIHIPAKGTLRFNSLVDIIINDTSIHAFKSGTYKELHNIPVYEGFNFELTFIDKAENKYTFWLNFHSKDCIKILKERLVSIQSCSDEAYKLYYYSQINLQNGMLDDLNKEVEFLQFNPAKGSAKEYDKNSNLINKIDIYDIKLNNEVQAGEEIIMTSGMVGQEWLYIKGVDSQKNIINKKYLVTISNNEACVNYFTQTIQNELNKYNDNLVKSDIFPFWVLSVDRDSKLSTIGKINNGMVNIRNNNISIDHFIINNDNNILKLYLANNDNREMDIQLSNKEYLIDFVKALTKHFQEIQVGNYKSKAAEIKTEKNQQAVKLDSPQQVKKARSVQPNRPTSLKVEKSEALLRHTQLKGNKKEQRLANAVGSRPIIPPLQIPKQKPNKD
jgi:hypothetical protein